MYVCNISVHIFFDQAGPPVKYYQMVKKIVNQFNSQDFYQLDDLLSDEQKLIRASIRDFVNKDIKPYIEDWAERNYFPLEMVKKFGAIGAFGPHHSREFWRWWNRLYLLWSNYAGNRTG
jgi:alkylation response protein AidB-like acyl-CoA dehydrogenase